MEIEKLGKVAERVGLSGTHCGRVSKKFKDSK
jgi:hypothetical protein